MSLTDVSYNVGTGGTISVAHSKSLITFDPQQAALDKFARKPMSAPPVSVNAWTNLYDQIEKGRIIGNVVI
ncbi:MAG: hypothetical protein ACOZEN_15290 [Thermodesulfobacteriota bacterium]